MAEPAFMSIHEFCFRKLSQILWSQTSRFLVALPTQFDICEWLVDLSEELGTVSHGFLSKAFLLKLAGEAMDLLLKLKSEWCFNLRVQIVVERIGKVFELGLEKLELPELGELEPSFEVNELF